VQNTVEEEKLLGFLRGRWKHWKWWSGKVQFRSTPFSLITSRRNKSNISRFQMLTEGSEMQQRLLTWNWRVKILLSNHQLMGLENWTLTTPILYFAPETVNNTSISRKTSLFSSYFLGFGLCPSGSTAHSMFHTGDQWPGKWT
jgi:hypothetical protein